MTWWGWLLLVVYTTIGWLVMYKVSGRLLDDGSYSGPGWDDYAASTFVGLLAGVFWGIFLGLILLGAALNPRLGKALLIKMDVHLPERTKKNQTDEEVRKEVERLRREYAMPRWKRAVLRLIRV